MKRHVLLFVILILCLSPAVTLLHAEAAYSLSAESGFYDVSGEEISEFYNKGDVSARVNLVNESDISKKVLVYCVRYIRNQMAEVVKVLEKQIEANTTEECSVDLSDISFGVDDTMKLMVWEDNLTPLSSARQMIFADGLYTPGDGTIRKLFIPCDTHISANTLIPDNFFVTDSMGEACVTQNVYYYPGEGILALEISGGLDDGSYNISSVNVTDAFGEQFEIYEETSLVAECSNPLFETSIKSIQLKKDGIAVSDVKSDGDYEISVTLANEGREEGLMLHIIKNSGSDADTAEIFPVGKNDKFSTSVSLLAGDTVYAVLQPSDEVFRLDLSEVPDGKYNMDYDSTFRLKNAVPDVEFYNIDNPGRIYEVITENGRKFVRTYMEGTKSATRMIVDLKSDAILTGTARIYAEYRAGEGTLQRNLVNFKKAYDGTQDAVTLSLSGTRAVYRRDSVKSVVDSSVSKNATLDADGFIKLCFEVSRDDAADDWTVMIYDELSADRALIAQGTISGEYMPVLKNFDIYHIYTVNDSDIGSYFDIGECFVNIEK
ncbi:MAG: hypothetical protein IJ454_02695 [Clostridia bacterium]|nr:hypothetical protein [Clostridia bacterium]